MADRGHVVLVGTLRAALQRGVDVAGLRPIARELSLDPSSVLNLLRGGNPRPSTRQRLLKWYFRQVREGHEGLEKELANEAAAALLAGFDAEARPEVIKELLREVRRLYVDRGLQPPTWLDEVPTDE